MEILREPVWQPLESVDVRQALEGNVLRSTERMTTVIKGHLCTCTSKD